MKNSVEPATGPLTIHPENRRCFADAHGQAVYLVGSHTWANFQDIGFEGDKPFDYDAYLDFMRSYRFNFMRLWNWEHSAWATWSREKVIFDPMPYRRTGPGTALDGKPKFDLTQFDQAYFDRMRARVLKAKDTGIYAAVMLFQAFSADWVWHYSPTRNINLGNPFRGHFYHKENNIQAFDGDTDSDSLLDLDDPQVREYQAAYLHKIVDTVNDLDNVLYEVINEGGTAVWNEFVMETVRNHEKTLPKQHLIGVTGHAGISMEALLASTADWIAPGFHDVKTCNLMTDPPVWDDPKVSILDTDHIWGHGIDYKWVWRSFLRGHHVLFMDPWGPLAGWDQSLRNTRNYPGYEEGRKAMRNTACLAGRLNLRSMIPHPELASTRFCLADPGKEYVLYLPDGEEIRVDLTAAPGEFLVEWIDPIQGTIIPGPPIAGGKPETFHVPFPNDAVLFLRAGPVHMG